jgi:uncharacterized protein (DUF433 family)
MPEDSQTAFPAVIRKTPGVIGGDACIGNRRIAVWMLVQARNLGMTDDEIRDQYEQPLSEPSLLPHGITTPGIVRKLTRPSGKTRKTK